MCLYPPNFGRFQKFHLSFDSHQEVKEADIVHIYHSMIVLFWYKIIEQKSTKQLRYEIFKFFGDPKISQNFEKKNQKKFQKKIKKFYFKTQKKKKKKNKIKNKK